MITTFYGDDMSRLPIPGRYGKTLQKAVSCRDAVFGGRALYGQSLVDLGCPPDKVRVQHLGVDLRRVQFIPRRQLEGEAVRILMVSSFREKKGIDYVCRHLHKLQENIQTWRCTSLVVQRPARERVYDKMSDNCRERRCGQ